MLHRTLSTLALWTIVFCALYFGGMWGAAALLVVLSALAQWEYYGLRQASGAPVYRGWGMTMGLVWMAFVAALCLLLFFQALKTLYGYTAYLDSALIACGILSLVLMVQCLFLCVRTAPTQEHLRAVVETLFGVFYVPVLLSFYMLIAVFFAGPETGVWLAVLVVAMAKFADVGGLLIGKAFGRHKIAPAISPKKSWEGLLGSVVFSMLVMLFAYYLPLWCEGAIYWGRWVSLIPLPAWLLFSAIVAVVSLLSDLTESAFKRVADKKDSGGVIPGIGGALDLCDSLLFTGPVAFVCILLWLTMNALS